MKILSLFSGAGIGDYYLSKHHQVLAANELDIHRAKLYSHLKPSAKMFEGNIQNNELKKSIFQEINSIDMIIATPPCQGVSSLGSNKVQNNFIKDPRNFLIFELFDFLEFYNPSFVLIENTERFANMYFPFNGSMQKLYDILVFKYSKKYEIHYDLLNCQDFGIPQSRPRSIFRLFKKGLSWNLPKKEEKISLKDSISYLPSLNPNEVSDIKWHYAKNHKPSVVECLRHTPEGKSALNNPIYYPKNKLGDKVNGFHNTYKRMRWDSPCPTRTTFMGSPSSHNNIHPGRKLRDGSFSDPRVLTLLETFIVSSLPVNIDFPSWVTDNFIRTVIGEGVPPLFLKKIVDLASK
jgi:DNA (cytosine-5)-methyltransferase 1